MLSGFTVTAEPMVSLVLLQLLIPGCNPSDEALQNNCSFLVKWPWPFVENCADGKWNEAMSMLQPLAGLRPNCYWTLLQVHNPYFRGRRDAHELTLFLGFLQILPQQPNWTSPLDSTNKALILLCLKRVLEGLDALGLSQLSRPTVM